MHLHLLAAVLAVLTLAPRPQAQCGRWSRGLATPGVPVGTLASVVQSDTDTFVYASAIDVFDDGSGAALYVAGLSGEPNGWVLQRHAHDTWDVLLVVPNQSAIGNALGRPAHGDVGAGPQLFVAETLPTSFGAFTGTSLVRAWDGTSWSTLPALADLVGELCVLDDGSGAALYAVTSKEASPGLHTSRVSRWNGASWTGLGATIPGVVTSLEVLDSGTGPKLYAGAYADTLPAASLHVWNGTAWSGIASLNARVLALQTYDDGSGAHLYAAAASPAATPSLRRFDGVSTWSTIAAVPFGAYALDVADIGAGEQLVVGGPSNIGFFDGTNYASTAVSGYVADFAVDSSAGNTRVWAAGQMESVGGRGVAGLVLHDGSTWRAPGAGFNSSVSALATVDFGGGPALVAAGLFDVAGDAPSVDRLARWTGTSWLSPAQPFDRDVLALAAYDVGVGARLFTAGSVQWNPNPAGVAAWNGTSWSLAGGALPGTTRALHGCDLGAGPRLYAAGDFTAPAAAGDRIVQWDGVATWAPLGAGVDAPVRALTSFDDGGGIALFAGGSFANAGGSPAARVARWNGSAWSTLGVGLAGGDVNALAAFDDGSSAQLYAGGTFTSTGATPLANLARWNGTSWSDLPGGGANGAVYAFHVHDDGRGPALYVGGDFTSIGGIAAANLARFDGAGWQAVDGGVDRRVRAFASLDDDGDGDFELFAGGDFQRAGEISSGFVARLEGCPHYASTCSGDGSTNDHATACPCGNAGAPGHGCANSVDANGALLAASGATQADTLVLDVSGMPASALGIYLQHDATGDALFHDGVICAGGNLLRLRSRVAAGGASRFPDTTFANDATLTLSQRGGVTPGSGVVRFYSTFYRNASTSFCPPATANVTNGVRVVW